MSRWTAPSDRDYDDEPWDDQTTRTCAICDEVFVVPIDRPDQLISATVYCPDCEGRRKRLVTAQRAGVK